MAEAEADRAEADRLACRGQTGTLLEAVEVEAKDGPRQGWGPRVDSMGWMVPQLRREPGRMAALMEIRMDLPVAMEASPDPGQEAQRYLPLRQSEHVEDLAAQEEHQVNRAKPEILAEAIRL